jgi:hypothetical protein
MALLINTLGQLARPSAGRLLLRFIPATYATFSPSPICLGG